MSREEAGITKRPGLVNLIDQRYGLVMEVTVEETKAHFYGILRRVEAGETVFIRRGQERVAMLVQASEEGGIRNIWGDHGGSIEPEFDDPPEDFAS